MNNKDEMYRFSRVLYKCMNCEHTFEGLKFFAEYEYGIRSLFCKKCSYHGIAYLLKDEYSLKIKEQLKNREKPEVPLGAGSYGNPNVTEFERLFDETVDPCPKCGGELSLSIRRRCPKCNSTNLEDIKIIGYIDTNERWITHNKMENK